MKTAISLASLFACALSLDVQILDAQISATLMHASNGLDQLRVRNDSPKNLEASVIFAKRVPRSPNSVDTPFVVYSDPLIEPAAKPLLAGEERLAISMGMNPGVSNPGTRFFEEPIVAAGIFADGGTTGDAALVAGLLLRRSNMLLAVDTTLETLSDAGRRNIPRDQLIGEFKKMADSLRRWYLPLEQQVGLGLYQAMIGKLMNLPEVPYGSPFPPAAFVAEETAVLRQERLTLSESQPTLADGAVIAR